MPSEIPTTISHAEAKTIALRLIHGAFGMNDPEQRPRFSIPANPSRDDDLRMIEYINQQEAADAKA